MPKISWFKVFSLTLVLFALCVSTENDTQGWKIAIAARQGEVSMTLLNPESSMKNESSVTIILDTNQKPIQGNVIFKNGYTRNLRFPDEADYFWETFHGQRTLWKYYDSLKALTVFSPGENDIPKSMFGRLSRVVAKDSMEYYGKLLEFPGNYYLLIIKGEDKNDTLSRNAISVIQQIHFRPPIANCMDWQKQHWIVE